MGKEVVVAAGAAGGASDGNATAAEAPREAPPHVYVIARKAYSALVEAMARARDGDAEAVAAAAAEGVHVDQSVLISGESGAGKTEAAKRVLEYLTAASRAAKEHELALSGGSGLPPRTPSGKGEWDGAGAPTADGPLSIEALLREASPVLEALGNAKTIRNDNSSRFGKYVAVQYGANGGIVGAMTETYLLERSRVVEVSHGERNYHIFYQLLTDEGVRRTWGLPEAANLAYLACEGHVATIEEMNDTREFAAVAHALGVFNFSADEIAGVWRLLAAVLLLGNVSFRPRAKEEGGGDEEIAEVVDEAALTAAVAALGTQVEDLRFPLLCKNIKVMQDTIVAKYTCKAAEQARDALAKTVFAALFDTIVGRINEISRGPAGANSIGILDIFGFESLKYNSFEQLCINYVNEMLQEQFNESVLAAETRLLESEGITPDDGALASSATRLTLMTKILQTLDDQCRLGERGSDEEYTQQIGQQHTIRGVCQLEQRGTFSIVHYAGKVLYNTDGFVMKNTDAMHADMQACMRTCAALAPVAPALFPDDDSLRGSATTAASESSARDASDSLASSLASVPEDGAAASTPRSPRSRFSIFGGRKAAGSGKMTGGDAAGGEAAGSPSEAAVGGSAKDVTRSKKAKPGAMTLGARLRAGIGEVSGGKGASPSGLMGRLRQTSVHYIRCVKPNDSMAAYGFEQQRVLLQLQCSGILEMVRIRRQGFPSRMPFREFERRFALLMYEPGGAAGLLTKMRSSMARMIVSTDARNESDQAVAEANEHAKAGTARCLLILKRAALHEHRHYAFGRTRVFLRNGVEGALLAAVEKQMLAVTWFQKEARKRTCMRSYAYARHVVIKTQAALRRNHAKNLVRRRLAVIRKRLDAMRKGYYAVRIAKWASRYAPAWLAKRRSAAIQCQRLARGHLGRRYLVRLRYLADRGRPLIKLRWSARMVCVQIRATRRMAALVVRRANAVITVQRYGRSVGPKVSLRRCRAAVMRLQGAWRRKAGKSSASRAFAESISAAFRAAFSDDEDGLRACLKQRPWLLLVRQNRPGQRAGLAHAAAAGGAVNLASSLLLQMHKAALAAGARGAVALPALPADAPPEERARRELGAALAYGQTLVDAIGRTPLHYASRWGQLDYVRWGVRLLSQQKPAAGGDEASAPAGADETAAAAEDADDEVKRAIVPVVLPTGGGRQRVLLVLGQAKLKVYPLPAKDASAADAAAIDLAALGKPKLSLAADKLTYAKSSDRLKRDCIEVVIMKAKRGGVAARMAAFEQTGGDDVLEIYCGSPTETRFWLAAMHSPRYLKARGAHLLHAVEGDSDAAEQPYTQIWRRWATLNRPDARGEGLLASAIRGVEPGDHAARGRMIAYLLDAGAECMPM